MTYNTKKNAQTNSNVNDVNEPSVNSFFNIEGLLKSFVEKVGEVVERKLEEKLSSNLLNSTTASIETSKEVNHPLYSAGKYETLATVWLLEYTALNGKKSSRDKRKAYQQFMLEINSDMSESELDDHDTHLLNAMNNLGSKTTFINSVGKLILD